MQDNFEERLRELREYADRLKSEYEATQAMFRDIQAELGPGQVLALHHDIDKLGLRQGDLPDRPGAVVQNTLCLAKEGFYVLSCITLPSKETEYNSIGPLSLEGMAEYAFFEACDWSGKGLGYEPLREILLNSSYIIPPLADMILQH
ncbi:MAG: hypothetical protein HGA85_03015 [Nanoarchaeota archaeon]|nr:hypothetical protein [Nanoarchaeota archaeon]